MLRSLSADHEEKQVPGVRDQRACHANQRSVPAKPRVCGTRGGSHETYHALKGEFAAPAEAWIVLAAVQDQAFGGVLTATARDGVAIQRPGREDGSAGAEPENDGEEESARRYRPLCIGASTVVERAD